MTAVFHWFTMPILMRRLNPSTIIAVEQRVKEMKTGPPLYARHYLVRLFAVSFQRNYVSLIFERTSENLHRLDGCVLAPCPPLLLPLLVLSCSGIAMEWEECARWMWCVEFPSEGAVGGFPKQREGESKERWKRVESELSGDATHKFSKSVGEKQVTEQGKVLFIGRRRSWLTMETLRVKTQNSGRPVHATWDAACTPNWE